MSFTRARVIKEKVIRYHNASLSITRRQKVAISPVKRKLILKKIINTTGISDKIPYKHDLSSER